MVRGFLCDAHLLPIDATCCIQARWVYRLLHLCALQAAICGALARCCRVRRELVVRWGMLWSLLHNQVALRVCLRDVFWRSF